MELEGLMNTRFVEAEFNSMMNRLGQVFPSEPGFSITVVKPLNDDNETT